MLKRLGQLFGRGGETAKLETALVEAAARFRASAAPVLVSLSSATAFDWDRLYVVGPYEPIEAIIDRVGVSVPRGRLHGIDARDDVVLLLFLHGDTPVADLAFQRRHADLLPLVRPEPYSRDEATLELVARHDQAAATGTVEVVARLVKPAVARSPGADSEKEGGHRAADPSR